MVQVNNFKDIIAAAVNEEKKAADFYQRALESVLVPGAKEMLRQLIQEELSHAVLLENVQQEDKYQPLINRPLPLDFSYEKYLNSEIITVNSTPQDILLAAIKNEANAAGLYAQKAAQFQGTELEPLFMELMQMEQSHQRQLEDLYETHFMQDN